MALGLILSPLPGPGGVPIVIAGLGLLSIHNRWASPLRRHVLSHSGRFVKYLFPANPAVQWFYDVVAVLLLAAVGWIAATHQGVWQLSTAASLFFIALFLALTNRARFERFRKKP